MLAKSPINTAKNKVTSALHSINYECYLNKKGGIMQKHNGDITITSLLCQVLIITKTFFIFTWGKKDGTKKLFINYDFFGNFDNQFCIRLF